MYFNLAPYPFLSADEAAEFAHAYWQVIKTVWIAMAIAALTILVLAGAFSGSLQMIQWCHAELSPIACSMYLTGF